jgi:hypothetical protein
MYKSKELYYLHKKGAWPTPERATKRRRLNPVRRKGRIMAKSVAQKVFYSVLFEDSGKLAKVDGELVFFGDNGDITTVEPSMINFLTVLGEVGVADTRQLMDRLHGGAAAIACSRLQEVA